MDLRRRAPRGVALLQALMLPLLLLLSPGPDSAAADGTVEKLKDGFDSFYKIYNYALGDPSEYKVASIASACECRRWCQVSASCQSVSVVMVDGDEVECRYSNKPVDITDITDRPRLNKTQGAIHFLSFESTSTETLGQTGVEFWWSGNTFVWYGCLAYCAPDTRPMSRMAVINTWVLLEDFMAITPNGIQFNINLKRNGEGEEPRWGGLWSLAPVTYSASEINTTTINDNTPAASHSSFSVKHDGKQVTFTGKRSSSYRCLCMDNPLNLEL